MIHYRRFFTQSEDCSFQCGVDDRCIPSKQECDGIPQCPNGADENLKICQSSFPPTATYKCLKPDVYNMEIEIMAVPCNGLKECKDGSDEENCKLPIFILVCIVSVGFLIITSIAIYMLYIAELEDHQEEVDFEKVLQENDFASKVTVAYLTMLQSVDSKPRIQINQRYYQ